MITKKYKNDTMSFIKEFDFICDSLDLDEDFIINNIVQVMSNFKLKSRDICVYEMCEADLMKISLKNNHDFFYVTQLNLVHLLNLRRTSL